MSKGQAVWIKQRGHMLTDYVGNQWSGQELILGRIVHLVIQAWKLAWAPWVTWQENFKMVDIFQNGCHLIGAFRLIQAWKLAWATKWIFKRSIFSYKFFFFIKEDLESFYFISFGWCQNNVMLWKRLLTLRHKNTLLLIWWLQVI